MSVKKFMNKISNLFDENTKPSQKLPNHNDNQQNYQQQNQQQPQPGVYPFQQQQYHYTTQQYQQQYQQPPPYGSGNNYNNNNNNNSLNEKSPQPGVYNYHPQQPQQPQHFYPQQTQQTRPLPPIPNNYNNNNLPPPPLSPPQINNITNHHHYYNNQNQQHHHNHQHQYGNNEITTSSGSPKPISPNFNNNNNNGRLSPNITGSGSKLSPNGNRINSTISPIPGAYGDGIHDDTLAVSKYLNQFPSNSIIIPPGNYLITQPITITRNNIQLLGSNNVTFTCNFSIWTAPPISQGFINVLEYVFVLSGDNIVLDSINANCTTINSLSSSFLYLKGNGFIMRNCIIDGFNQGVVIGVLNDCSGKIPPGSHFSNIKITANQITNVIGTPGGSICYGDGICFFGCTNVLISNNFVSAKDGFTPRNGINSGPEGFLPSTNVQYLNNTIRGDWDYALTTEGGNQCTLSNNDIQGSCICGIIERGTDIKVSNNNIHIIGREKDGQTQSTGIQFYGVDNGEVSNNSIMGSAVYAILIKPSHESGGGNNTTVENNTIDGDFYNCIFLSNTNTSKIHGNVVMGKSQVDSCVGLQLWYANGLDIQSNNIDLPNGTACICSGTKSVNVLSNTMMTSRAGFYICQGSKDICIQNNDLIGVTQTKFDQSNDNSTVTTSQNYGYDYSPPINNNNDNNNNHHNNNHHHQTTNLNK